MNHTYIKSVPGLALIVFLASFVWESKVDPLGTWEYKAYTEQGHTGTFEIISEQGHLSGNLKSEGNDYTMEKLSVDGNQMNFEVTTIDGYLCKVAGTIDGDHFSATLTVDYDDMGFEATRIKK